MSRRVWRAASRLRAPPRGEIDTLCRGGWLRYVLERRLTSVSPTGSGSCTCAGTPAAA
jgi:hypothetical protein